MAREFEVFITEYGLALPTGNAKGDTIVIEKSRADRLANALENITDCNCGGDNSCKTIAEVALDNYKGAENE